PDQSRNPERDRTEMIVAKRPRPKRPGDTTRPSPPPRSAGRQRPGVPRPSARTRTGRTTSDRPASSPGSRPARGGNTPASPLRESIARASYPWLVRIHRVPRLLLVATLLALLIAGILAPRWIGTACLVIVLAFLAWLTYLAWPEGDRGRRVLRM